MAEASISCAEDQFCCPVCLDLLNVPVTIPCGHSYCMSCISDVWDQEDQKGIYKCPLCKQSFSPRPVLGKNVVIAEMVEKLMKTRLQAAGPAVHHTESGDVQCDSCTGIKQKAVKSCLECQSSYCQNHLEQHENLFRSKKHNLMDATGRLQEMICSQHDKMLEIYCRTDQQCICMMCLVDEHKNHDTVSTVVERKEKQRYFEDTQRNIQKKIQQKEKDLQEVREAVKSHKNSAQTAVEDSERIFTELIHSIEKCRSEVKQLIRDQERAAVSRAEELLEQLELELDDLIWRDAELKQLSETKDHVHFLKSLSSVSFSESTDGFTFTNHSFDDVVKSVSQLRDKLQQFSIDEAENISKRVKIVQVIQTPEYQARGECLQYSHPMDFTAKETKPPGSTSATPFTRWNTNPPASTSASPFTRWNTNPPASTSASPFTGQSSNPLASTSASPFTGWNSNPPASTSASPFTGQSSNPLASTSASPFTGWNSNPPASTSASPFTGLSSNPPASTSASPFTRWNTNPPASTSASPFTGLSSNPPASTSASPFTGPSPNPRHPPPQARSRGGIPNPHPINLLELMESKQPHTSLPLLI
uniref:E3 ubiquitin/ISG15 ligase TRIM25-like n=1 Tax=Cyprinus carpio carpio TaxID=630221 RepID=A0A9J8CRA9_CYPCA